MSRSLQPLAGARSTSTAGGSREPIEGSPAPAVARFLREAYLAAVDSWIPETLQLEGGERLRRARIVVGLTLVLFTLGLEAFAFFHWALPLPGATAVDVALLVGFSLTLCIPRVLRRYVSIELAANLLVGAAFIVLVTIFVVLGGIRAPVLHWCALVPMLAVLMGAQRWAWAWAAASAAILLSFAAVEVQNVPLPDYLDVSGLVGERLWLQRLIDVGSWIGILLAIGLLYERHKSQQTAELGSTNAELTREIAQRRKAEQRTRYLAYYDELTALPNRQFFREQLEPAMREAERDDRMVAVMFLDLDSFKDVNDSYGHRLGDQLLQQVAERLRACIRNADAVFRGSADEDGEQGGEDRKSASIDEDAMISRLGGDEFTVLLVNLRNENEAAIVARRILHAFEAPFRIEDHQIHTSTSIGIALYPRDVQDVNELLKNADLAMYSAKERGKNNYQFFTQSMNAEIVHRTTLANELRRARDEGEFVLHYQPILETSSRVVVAVEALIRWQHPVRGLLLPGEFIEIAEETRLIVPIADEVLMRACAQNRAWQQRGLPPVRMAVNISGVQLRHRGLAQSVANALQHSGLEARYLELEITESAMMEDEQEAARSLVELKALGIRISLDDFGTGYSSLSYLQRYPVDALKIDRSFVSGVASDSEAQAITTAIVAMAHGLELKVVAEGVETAAQEAFLAGLCCDELQGYRFCRPAPAEEIEHLLRAGVVTLDPSLDLVGSA